MSSQQKSNQIYWALLAIALIVTAAVGIHTEPARNLGIDVFVEIILYIAFISLSISTMIRKNQQNRKMQIFAAIAICATLLIMVDTIRDGWPRLPWVKVEAFNTANHFMTDLKNSDEQAALAYLTVGEECVSSKELSDPKAQPVNWVFLTEMDQFSNIHGTAAFSDGKETGILLRMRWLDNRWQIDGVHFETYPDVRLDLDFLTSRCAQ